MIVFGLRPAVQISDTITNANTQPTLAFYVGASVNTPRFEFVCSEPHEIFLDGEEAIGGNSIAVVALSLRLRFPLRIWVY